MRKLSTLFIFIVISLCFASSIDAQRIRLGLKGGLNFSDASIKDVANAGESQTYTGFNAGLALNVKLLLGFSVQPELIYTQTGMKFGLKDLENLENSSLKEVTQTITQGTIELPVNIQWGIKLGPVRPYLQASPYIAYSVLDKIDIGGSVEDIVDPTKFQYGVGIGMGIDVWKFQLSYRYKWDLTVLGEDAIIPAKIGKLRGSEINLAFFF